MKSIRISDKSYRFFKELSVKDHRSLISMIDLFVSVFIDHEKGLATKSLSSKEDRKK